MYQFDITHHGADGIDRQATIYRHDDHDLVAIETILFVRVNDGQLSSFISDWRPIHYDVQRHFGLSVPQTKTLGF